MRPWYLALLVIIILFLTCLSFSSSFIFTRVTLSYDYLFNSWESHRWTECLCTVFTCGAVHGRKPLGTSWMHLLNQAQPLSLWCTSWLFLRLKRRPWMTLFVPLYRTRAHVTRPGSVSGSLWCFWMWITKMCLLRVGPWEDFLAH